VELLHDLDVILNDPFQILLPLSEVQRVHGAGSLMPLRRQSPNALHRIVALA